MSSAEAGRPRASLLSRIVRFPLSRILIVTTSVVVAVLLTSTLANTLLRPHLTGGVLDPIYQIIRTALRTGGGIAVYLGAIALLERRKAEELSLPGALRETGAGMGIACLMLATVMGMLALCGCYRVTEAGTATALASAFIMSADAAVLEEIVFRGVLFRIVEESLGTWFAVALSAALFGFLHLLNDNSTWFSSLAIALEAGILLAAAYSLTRRLWFAAGLHLGWNFTEGGIFGAPVSGYPSEGLLKGELTGPTILSGGEFGPEASLVTLLLCLSAGVVMLWLARRRDHFIAPFWARRDPPAPSLEEGASDQSAPGVSTCSSQ